MTSSAQDTPRKKVVIMTVGFGGGHKAMGRNLTNVIQDTDTSIEVKVIDVIHDARPSFSNNTAKAYETSTGSMNAFWFKMYYVLTDRYPWIMQLIARAAFTSYARKKFQQEKPDLLIATFPLIADVAVAAREFHHVTTPVVVAVTDAGRVQGIWLSKHADMTLTATPDTVEYLASRGMDKNKLRYVGFPAAKTFYEPTPRLVARKRLGLDAKLFTILVTAGGAGLNQQKVVSVAREIGKLRVPYQIILNAGNNESLKRAFEALKFPYAEKIIVEGFTDKMPDYMCASDIICCKSGWLTVNEALVLQKPFILYDAIPGHEEQNVKFVVDNNYGVFESDSKKVAERIRRFIADPTAFDHCINNMKQAGTNKSPYDELSALIQSYLIKQ